MSNNGLYITASCVISAGAVYKNDVLVYSGVEDQVSDFLAGIYHHIKPDYPKYYKMDNLSKLGWLATEILLKDSFKHQVYSAEQVGVVLSNSNASLDTDFRYFKTVQDYPSPSLFVYTLPNIVTGEICIRHHFLGENAFFISDEFDPGFIANYTSGLFNIGAVECCICGWVELLAHQYTAALYLVEKNGNGQAFTARIMAERPGLKINLD
jgi:hypothetical protein